MIGAAPPSSFLTSSPASTRLSRRRRAFSTLVRSCAAEEQQCSLLHCDAAFVLGHGDQVDLFRDGHQAARLIVTDFHRPDLGDGELQVAELHQGVTGVAIEQNHGPHARRQPGDPYTSSRPVLAFFACFLR